LAKFRIETKIDPKTGKVYAELYYPDDAEKPLATTDPIFQSREVAVEHIKKMCKEWMSEMGKM